MTDFVAYVYIMASSSKCLYIGVTTTLEKRVHEHKSKAHPDSFTARYNCTWLVHVERYGDIHNAIARETQLKKWSRLKKLSLIVQQNPDWRDLSADWGKPVKPWDGTLRPPEKMPW